MMSNYKTLLFLLAYSLLTLTCLPIAIAEEEPQDIILGAFREGIDILNSPELQGEENLQKRRRELWLYLKPHFDLEEMAKRALGGEWHNISDEERNEFTDVFIDILRNFYLGKTDTYRGEEIKYIRRIIKGKRCKVQTRLFTVNGDKFIIDFSLIRHNNTWKVYDLAVEGVSVISNYRSQFKSILSKKSFEELMEQLRKKREDTAIEGLE